MTMTIKASFFGTDWSTHAGNTAECSEAAAGHETIQVRVKCRVVEQFTFPDLV
jgi:hypothetical protein